MQYIYDVSCEAEKLITSKNFNLKHIGNLLSEQWEYKKKLSKNISNNKINDIYDLVMRQGAYGGKLMGAGSGGFIVFIGNRDLEKKINQSSKKLKTLRIKIDFWGQRNITLNFDYLSKSFLPLISPLQKFSKSSMVFSNGISGFQPVCFLNLFVSGICKSASISLILSGSSNIFTFFFSSSEISIK